jgi:ubiquinol-cytochrome c reductase iron-sulfur subunit
MSESFSTPSTMDASRRNILIATSGVSALGAACVAVPFLSTLSPSEKAKAAGAPIEVDISDLKAGEMKTVEWRGKPVWILKRTPEMLASLKKTEGDLADPKSQRNQSDLTPSYAQNSNRSIKPEILVAVGICSHLGCSPTAKLQGGDVNLPAEGGFICPCHGSTFDMAGRVYKNKPAPDNLQVPPHMYLSDNRILVGEDKA